MKKAFILSRINFFEDMPDPYLKGNRAGIQLLRKKYLRKLDGEQIVLESQVKLVFQDIIDDYASLLQEDSQ